MMQFFIHFLQHASRICTTNAAAPAIALIIVMEFFLQPYLSQNFFSHEVDWTLHYLKKPNRNHPVVAIGDSVGYGIFSGWQFNNGAVATLACNQATETAGQYFFLKRFIENNRVPGAVLSCDRMPFSGNLDQNLTENYVQRCFTNWSEIYDLMIIKLDPVFTAKMVFYKLFPALTYRLHLQRKLVGFSNSDIYSGITYNIASLTSSESNYGLIRLLENFKEHHRSESISTYFLKKMLKDLKAIGVPLYYMPPPSRFDNNDNHQLIQKSIKLMEEMQKEFDNLYVIHDKYFRLPGIYFGDEVHLNQEGLHEYRPKVQSIIENIIANSKQWQSAKLSSILQSGKQILSIELFGENYDVLPLHDVSTNIAGKEIVITSLGTDPAVLLPEIPDVQKESLDRVLVRIKMDSSVQTTSGIYYTHPSSSAFSEQHFVPQRVLVGSNNLFFILPTDFIGGSLRFDPAMSQGTFRLQQVEVRVLNGSQLNVYLGPGNKPESPSLSLSLRKAE